MTARRFRRCVSSARRARWILKRLAELSDGTGGGPVVVAALLVPVSSFGKMTHPIDPIGSYPSFPK
ncbi:MAG: hypothetical protein ACLQD8_03810 [Thermoplasmata archaeon]